MSHGLTIKKKKNNRTKLKIKDKFRSIIVTSMTVISKANKHATVSVKKGKEMHGQKVMDVYYQNTRN